MFQAFLYYELHLSYSFTSIQNAHLVLACNLTHNDLAYSGADLRQKAWSDTSPEGPPLLPSLLLPSLLSLSLLSPSFPFPPLPFPPPLSPPPFPSLPLRSRTPLIQLGGLGERCKLPQRGLGRRPSRNRIWCILALSYDIWWHVMWQQCCNSSTSSTVRVLGGSAARLQLGSRP